MTFCSNNIQWKNYKSLEVVVDEVESYLHSTETAVNLLSFWQAKEIMWPKLSKWLLSFPAKSTTSERAFCVEGRTLDESRLQLKPEIVDGLLFIHGLPVKR